MGSGPTGFSTGAGPFTYFTESGRSRGGSGIRTQSVTAYERQARALTRQQQIAAVIELDRELVRIGSVHEHDFPIASPPEPVQAASVDERAFLTAAEKEELVRVPLLRRSARRAARQTAKIVADQRISKAHRDAEAERARRDAQLTESWQALNQNHPARVIAALEAAFADNESPAVAVRVEGATVDLVMYWPELESVVGERKPAMTPSGKPTHHQRSKTERNRLYLETMASNVLATVREAFAVAPGLESARLLVVRQRGTEGPNGLDALFAGRFSREMIQNLAWAQIDAAEILKKLDDAELRLRGRTQELTALDVSADGGLADVLSTLASQLRAREPSGGGE